MPILKHMAINSQIKTGLFILYLCLISACNDSYLPKPVAYHKIEIANPNYIGLNLDFPYSFEYNSLAKPLPYQSAQSEPYWLDLHYDDFDASVQITYKSLNRDENKLREIITDAFRLASKHQVRAYSIQETIIKTPLGYTGVLAEISGEVPSQFQFFSTDSSTHFIRGALYFNTATKNDSLAPIIEYIKRDMVHMLNTLEWKN
jgi:gliding motility-associated lipoprotein GldD